MSKVKGRYVATVILDIEYDESEGRPFDEVYREIHSGGMAMAISDAIGRHFCFLLAVRLGGINDDY